MARASREYSEHDGWKRHREGSLRLTTCQARTGTASTRAGMEGLGRRSLTGPAPRVGAAGRQPGRPRSRRGRAGPPTRSAPPVLPRTGTRRRLPGLSASRRPLHGVASAAGSDPRLRPHRAPARTRRGAESSGRPRRRSRRPSLDGGAARAREPRTCHVVERARSGGQTLATAPTAGCQHRATAPCAHPHPEPVGLAPLPVVGLEGPLHAWPPRGGGPEDEGAAP